MKTLIALIIPALLLISCAQEATQAPKSLQTDDLIIKPLGAHTYQHISYLTSKEWGRVACNGMIFVKDGEAIVLDAPVHNAEAEVLIAWVRDSLGAEIKAVIPTHFHIDCLGGLEAFHAQGIPSHALDKTIALAAQDSATLPQQAFAERLELTVGWEPLIIAHHGAGHTPDNVIAYFPMEQTLFGGCLIKVLGAGKGNLNDADTLAWPATVTVIKAVYPDATHILPGHGIPGGREQLDYTEKLFGQ